MEWAGVRDRALFLSGLAGVAYETLSEGPPRPELLMIYAAMMGLPAFLQDKKKNGTA